MRACINTKCVAFGRIVYSVATRCPLCKWDLNSVAPASEASAPSTKPAALSLSALARKARSRYAADIFIPKLRVRADKIFHHLNALGVVEKD